MITFRRIDGLTGRRKRKGPDTDSLRVDGLEDELKKHLYLARDSRRLGGLEVL